MRVSLEQGVAAEHDDLKRTSVFFECTLSWVPGLMVDVGEISSGVS